MKRIYTWLMIAFMILSMSISSCVDDIAFGNTFLEKAPGADVTEDTVFSNAEYTRQFLNAIYALQYYGLPWQSASDFPYGNNYWTGSVSNLTECYQMVWSSSGIYKACHQLGSTSSEVCRCTHVCFCNERSIKLRR